MATIRLRTLGAVFAAILAFFVSGLQFAYGQSPVAAPTAGQRVTDLTGTLSSQEQLALANKLATLERTKGAQVAVLIVPTTAGEPIEQFALRVAEAWKLGRGTPPKVVPGTVGGKVNDGLLILVAKDDRKMRIEVGYGLEGAIPDAFAKRIINETILPRFKQNDFYGGLDAGLGQVSKLIDGESLPAPWSGPSTQTPGPSDDGLFENLPFMLFGLIFALFFLPRLFGRRLGAFVGGGGATALGYLGFGWPLVVALGGGAVLFFLILVFGGALAGNWRRAVLRTDGWGNGPIIIPSPGSGGWGGGWEGGSRGGGDNSGFGGGGGDFGGGGASGDW